VPNICIKEDSKTEIAKVDEKRRDRKGKYTQSSQVF